MSGHHASPLPNGAVSLESRGATGGAVYLTARSCVCWGAGVMGCADATKMEFLKTSLSDFEFRNGYFYKYAKMAGTRVNAAGIKVEVPDTTPYHTEYLLEAKEMGLIKQAQLDAV